ncbi:MAG: hypothetical protein ACRDJM_01015 [Actinomycetota bacterium]
MRRIAAAALLAIVAGACQQRVDPGSAITDLQARAGRVRAAAVAGNVDVAAAELAALNDAAGFWRRLGALDQSHADRIIAAATAVIHALPPVAEPSVEPTNSEEDEGEERGKKRRRGSDGESSD